SAATALAQPFTWKFTTRAGKLWQIEADGQIFDPQANPSGYNLSQLPKITLRFLQPMQPAGANAAISLVDSAGKQYSLREQWSGDAMSVLVIPMAVLPMNSSFILTVGADALTQDGGKLGAAVRWNLNTVPPPAVVSSNPANGATNAEGMQLALQFASPMDVKTIASRVVFTPPLANKNNFYYDEQGQTAYFYGLAPSTAYQVQVLPGMTDRYGNAMNSGQTIKFTTAALMAQAGFNMPYNAEYLVGGSQQFFYYYTNASWLDIKLYQVNAKDFVRYNASGKGLDPSLFKPDDTRLMTEYRFTGDAPLDATKTASLALKDRDGKPVPPGYYFLSMDAGNVDHSGRTYVDTRFVVVTQAHLTFKTSTSDGLVWATDPASGKPLPGLSIQVIDGDSNVLAGGKTDKDGLLHVDLPAWDPNQGYPSRIAVSQDPNMFAYTSADWDSGVYPEQFGINQGFYMPATNLLAYVYTDRPLYRPGQPVYFKGIVRSDSDLAYSLPSQKQVEVIISNFSQEVYRQTLTLDKYGAFNGQMLLDPEAALGGYSVMVNVAGASKDTPALGMLSFTVAEYRKPEFQVQVSATPANLLAGATITANVAAAYY
ncbi:MAG TPA: Ig-like domain-containing protein, partial [Polyangia bacterium]